MIAEQTCRASQLTPPGRGAIAAVLIDGQAAAEIADAFFQPHASRLLVEIPLGRIAFGRWKSSDGPGEEVVVCRTRPDAVEVHCHGGRAAVEAIIESLAVAGCQVVPWQDMAAFLERDAIAAEARVALAAATTQRTAGILLDQLHGALAGALRAVQAELSAGRGQVAAETLAQLQRRAAVGLHLTSPFRVVIAGRPNVGKSSLINALLGYARAIVFDQPGTTRDVLTAGAALEGWPVELIDTAGLRRPGDDIERQGVDHARRIAGEADLVMLVCDASAPTTDEDRRLWDAFRNALLVHNKCDLPRAEKSVAAPDVWTSAKTGENLPALIALLAGRLVPHPPAASEPVPFTERQTEAIGAALHAIQRNELTASAEILERLISARSIG